MSELITSRAAWATLLQIDTDLRLLLDDKASPLLAGLLESLGRYPAQSEQGQSRCALETVALSLSAGLSVQDRELAIDVVSGEKARFLNLLRAESAGAINSVARRAI